MEKLKQLLKKQEEIIELAKQVEKQIDEAHKKADAINKSIYQKWKQLAPLYLQPFLK